MRGRSGAHLLGVGNRWYVVKFMQNNLHRRVLINEWVGAHLARYLEIESPSTALVYVGPELSAQINASSARLNALVQPGIHLGSAFPGSHSQQVVYDFLPRSLMKKVQNGRVFWAALTLDEWVFNAESRQAVFTRPKGLEWLADSRERELSSNDFLAACIDQGSFFGGRLWRLPTVPSGSLHFESSVYADITGIDDLEPWLERIRLVPEGWLMSLVDSLPISWLANDREDLTRLLTDLYDRRNLVADLVIQTARHKPNMFPSWSGLAAGKSNGSQRCMSLPQCAPG